MTNPDLIASQIAFSAQVESAMRSVVLPAQLMPPSSGEQVGPRRMLSRMVLASGEQVGPATQMSTQASRRPAP